MSKESEEQLLKQKRRVNVKKDKDELGMSEFYWQKQQQYLVGLSRRYKSSMKELKEAGLFGVTSQGQDWRSVVGHQLMAGAVAETICELLSLDEEKKRDIVSFSINP